MWPSALGRRDWIGVLRVLKFGGIEAGCVSSCVMSMWNFKTGMRLGFAVHIDLRMQNHNVSDERLARHQREVLAYMFDGTGSTLGQGGVGLRGVEGVHESMPMGEEINKGKEDMERKRRTCQLRERAVNDPEMIMAFHGVLLMRWTPLKCSSMRAATLPLVLAVLPLRSLRPPQGHLSSYTPPSSHSPNPHQPPPNSLKSFEMPLSP